MASYAVSLFSRRDGFVDLAFTFRSLNRVAFYRRDQGWNPLVSRRRRPYHGSIAGWLLNGPIATSGPAIAHPRNQGPSILVQGLGHSLLWSQYIGSSLDEAPLGAPDERWEWAESLPDGDDWSNWQYLGGDVASAPAAATPDDDRIEVFVRRRDGRLYQASFDGTSWLDLRYIAHAWPDTAADRDGGPLLASDPVAISTDRDHTHVFAIAADNTLRGWHWRNDNRWRMNNYGNGGGLHLAGRPAVSSWDSTRLDVFVPTLEGPTLWLIHDVVGSNARFDEWMTGWLPWQTVADWFGTLGDVEWGVPWDVAAISWTPDALNLYGFDELLEPPARELWFEARYEKVAGWIPNVWAHPSKSLQPAAP